MERAEYAASSFALGGTGVIAVLGVDGGALPADSAARVATIRRCAVRSTGPTGTVTAASA